jgi:hypothetical protein
MLASKVFLEFIITAPDAGITPIRTYDAGVSVTEPIVRNQAYLGSTASSVPNVPLAIPVLSNGWIP